MTHVGYFVGSSFPKYCFSGLEQSCIICSFYCPTLSICISPKLTLEINETCQILWTLVDTEATSYNNLPHTEEETITTRSYTQWMYRMIVGNAKKRSITLLKLVAQMARRAHTINVHKAPTQDR